MRPALRSLLVAGVVMATPAAVWAAGDDTKLAMVEASDSAAELAPEPSTIVARVDLSTQRMSIYVNDVLTHTFPVSTGRGSYGTPTGRWTAQWLSPKHRSRKYDNAPLPWSVFFYSGYAVHGTTDLKALGRPASHGCVRLHPDNAKTFYSLVKEIGLDNTLITIVR
jgi:lipoprotein-anchoring transpeptidase ErfK/SrfK